MKDFKRSKIRQKPPTKPLSEKTKHNIITAFGILLIILVLYYGGLQLFEKLSNTRLIGALSGVFSKDLLTDERNHTNILALGVGGEGHEGKDLTDTMIIVSIDHTKKHLSLLSIPRDLYVESSLGGGKLNSLYDQGKAKWGNIQGLDFTRETIAKIFGFPIHYVIKIDFVAFEKLVNSIGGIDIYVEKTINDPFYPRGETYEYELFFLPQGNQHLNGKTALKYIRSRETTSDFDRNKRQQQLLVALKNKAQAENIFTKQNILKQIYYSIRNNIESDLSIREFLALASFATEWNSNNLTTAALNDEPIYKGGFLYTPLRKLYGTYVLLPAGDTFDSIRAFVQLIFYGPQKLNESPIVILNGTKQGGLAGKTKNILNRFGIQISSVANAETQDIEKTTWYTRSPNDLLAFLQKLIPGEEVTGFPSLYEQDPNYSDVQLILVLGKDALPVIAKLDIFRNVVSLVPGSGTTTQPK